MPETHESYKRATLELFDERHRDGFVRIYAHPITRTGEPDRAPEDAPMNLDVLLFETTSLEEAERVCRTIGACISPGHRPAAPAKFVNATRDRIEPPTAVEQGAAQDPWRHWRGDPS